MDNATGGKAVIAAGAHFKGQIKNARSIEINGVVEADLKADKVTIGPDGQFVGAITADLAVISGDYDGKMNAGSIWATATAKIAGEIQYKTLQMDRGAALNCRVIYNWKPEKPQAKKQGLKAPKKRDDKVALTKPAEDSAEDAVSKSPKPQKKDSNQNTLPDNTSLGGKIDSSSERQFKLFERMALVVRPGNSRPATPDAFKGIMTTTRSTLASRCRHHSRCHRWHKKNPGQTTVAAGN